MYYYQYLRFSIFVLKFSIMMQSHLQLINDLSLHIELNFVGKKTVIIGAVNCWNKIQNNFRDQSLRSLSQIKLKLFLPKDALIILVIYQHLQILIVMHRNFV